MSKNKEGSLKPGSILGSYEIIRLIGKGGMGEVYEAYEPSLSRRVALKIIPKVLADKDPELARRFDSEGKVLAQLNHPNVVIVHSLGQADGIHYLTMEYVDGLSLKEFIRQSSFSLEKALPIFQQIVAGVDALHRSGVIHRDMKPANVIYRKDGSIKIVDLGIAKVAEDTNFEHTRAGEVVGSPLYMSAEVASGFEATTQSDIWGIGIILYEMLTGENPFKGKEQATILKKIKENELEFSKDLLRNCPYEFLKIIKRMCEKDRAKRYKNTAEIKRDLEAFIRNREKEEQGLAADISATATLAKTSSRKTLSIPQEDSNKQPYWLYAMAIAVVVGAFFTWKSTKTTGPTDSQELTSASSISLTAPEDHQVLWQEKNQAINFNWTSQGKLYQYYLQVATDPEFRQIFLNQKNPQSPFKTSLLAPEKRYYWRILSLDKDGSRKASGVSEFTLTVKQAPNGIFPSANTRIPSEEPGSMKTEAGIRLEWQNKITVDRYRVQIAREFTFVDAVYDQTVMANSIKGILLSPGNYYWRVRAAGNSPIADLWSTPIPFSVYATPAAKPTVLAYQEKKAAPPTFKPSSPRPASTTRPRLVPPQLKRPRVGTTLEYPRGTRNPSALAPNSYPTLSWSSVKGASSYLVQISLESGFSQVTEEQEVTKNSFQWKTVVPGSYYWRVSSKNNEESSSFSSIGTIDAFFPAPELTVPSQVTLTANNDPINIKWRSTAPTTSYIIKVSNNKSFGSNVRAYQSNSDNFDLPLEGSGLYYVKVAALNDRGELVSQYSRVSSFRASTAPKAAPAISLSAPQVNSPADGATAVGFAGVTPVAFSWEEVRNASTYEIEFSMEKGFRKPFLREQTGDTQLVLKTKLPSSKIYWRMRSKKNNSSSPWTEPRLLDVQGEPQ